MKITSDSSRLVVKVRERDKPKILRDDDDKAMIIEVPGKHTLAFCLVIDRALFAQMREVMDVIEEPFTDELNPEEKN